MNKIKVLSSAFLLLLPCWLFAQDVTDPVAQEPNATLTPPAAPTPADIPQIDSTSTTPLNYEITSYEPTTTSASDSSQTNGNASTPELATSADSTQSKPETAEQAPDTTANAAPETAPAATAEISAADSTQKEQQPQVAEGKPETEEPQPKAEENKQQTEKAPATKDNKSKRFWGGITAGITYNDYFSTKFGLDDIKPSKDYNLTISGADDLLSNFWGVGFKFGMSGMFIASPYFNLRGDLSLALRQGSGKTNTSVILDWKKSDLEDQKSDMEIEYSASQLNIDFPILARVSIPNAIYFEAGPMFSFNVYSKSESKITDIYGTEKFEEKGGLKAFEFDIAAGLGISRSIGKSMLDFDLRFVFGMTRISDSDDAPKTWQGQLNITYWFL